MADDDNDPGMTEDDSLDAKKPRKQKKVEELLEKEEADLDKVERLEKEEGEALREMEAELQRDEKTLRKDEAAEEESHEELEELEHSPVPRMNPVKQPKAPLIKGAKTEEDEEEKEEGSSIKVKKEEAVAFADRGMKTHIFSLRTTANREDQVMSFIASNVQRKKLPVYSVVRPHGMRGYIFLEAESLQDAEHGAFGVPYARGILPREIAYHEIEHMLERVKKDVNIQKNDIAEIISGPFKREKCKITRIDKQKEEVVVELLEAAVPIPITVRMDAVKVIRRDTPDENN